MTAEEPTVQSRPGRVRQAPLGIGGVALLVAFAYVVVLGGTGVGELHPFLRLINAGIGAILIGIYLVHAPRRADRLDLAVIGALVLFAISGTLSQFPRQSFDAVLAALTYAAGFFVARELLSREPLRRAFLRTAMGLSVLITIVIGSVWLPGFLEFWALTGWAVLPPLDIPFSAGPWGHRYDPALLIALLYPAWWVGPSSPLRRAAAVVLGLVAVAIILVTGSRTVWLAVAMAVAVVALPWLLSFLRRHPRARVPAAVGLAVAGATLVVIGATGPLLERMFSFASAGWRLAMWGPLTELWAERPLAGVGPGSFPWALQLTPYFDTNSHAPRHPDSLLFQLLPETGLLGVLAILLIGVALVFAVVRSGSMPARWAAAIVVIASIGTNPTEFAFLVTVGIAWAAYGVPHRPREGEPPMRSRSRAVLALTAMAAGIVVLAYSATVIAGFAYGAARAAADAGRLEDAAGSFDLASSLDPGMALYVRQRGALGLLTGHPNRAVAELSRAVALNPSDDVAWRSLALAHNAGGEAEAARAAIGRAAEVQRSDPTNLLLQARLAVETGRDGEAVDILAEVVQTWPSVVAAPDWPNLLPDGASTREIVDAAARRWRSGAPMPELPGDQGLWLSVFSADRELLQEAIDATGERHARGYLALLGCSVDTSELTESPTAAEQRGYLYWSLRSREAAERGQTDPVAARALRLLGGASGPPAPTEINPLNEGPGWSADRWGYRRYSIEFPPAGVSVPAIQAGAGRWFNDPEGTARSIGLEDRLHSCSMP